MFDFNKPKIEITEISDDKKYGRFVVEPLERGYGITLGNSLRRIMLSSLPGAAVSQVKIEGVLHEFSSIPGVKEDVTEIIMNLKSLAIRNNSETNEAKVAYIEFEGEGVVRASDIQVDQDIEIMNPDQVIATLNGGPDSKLYMEMTHIWIWNLRSQKAAVISVLTKARAMTCRSAFSLWMLSIHRLSV